MSVDGLLSYLGAGKQFTVGASLSPLRKEMDTQLSDSFQGHAVKLLKCMGTQAALALGLLSWDSCWLQGSYSEPC